MSAREATDHEDLNPEQRQAVEHCEGPLLVLAGAGSGKTRVLTHRIAYLLRSGRAKPSEILAITFTNKAAEEMRERSRQLVGRVGGFMWIMTFHSACTRILRNWAERLGFTSRFTIYDESDSLRLIKRCMDDLELDQRQVAPRAVRSLISGAKNQLLDASAYSEGATGTFERTTAEVFDLYERKLRSSNAMDFDDLLLKAVNLLEGYEDVLERYRRAFRWILVDEYQDTNHAQYRLLQLLAEGQGNICVVGDDDQSIYRFRGADIRNILDFEKDFPGCTTVKLEQNYRSTQNILSAAGAVVSNNSDRKPKSLWTEAGAGEAIHLVELEDEHVEARFVAAEIEQLCEEGASLNEVAVFYRTNAQSRVLEDTLVRYGINYQVIGGTKFYERAEVKDALAYLSLLANSHDDVAFRRIANSPKRGIGGTTLSRLTAHANTVGAPLWDLASRPEDVPGLGTAAVKALRGLGDMLAPLVDLVGETPVPDLLEKVLEESGYVKALESQRTIEAQGRVENLQELVGVAGEYQEISNSPSLEEFLQQAALYSDQDELEDGGGQVTLMTLHNAKGLEFPAVFITGCEEGIFPHSRSTDEDNLDEERRLCYVGMTRAMERLYMTHTGRRSLFGERTYNATSRFLEEIPAEFTDVAGGDGRAMKDEASWDGGISVKEGEGEGVAVSGSDLPVPFKTGEDVYHATFGEGVVIDLEPGGVVLVRFSKDGSERKLMSDYAPLAHRS